MPRLIQFCSSGGSRHGAPPSSSSGRGRAGDCCGTGRPGSGVSATGSGGGGCGSAPAVALASGLRFIGSAWLRLFAAHASWAADGFGTHGGGCRSRRCWSSTDSMFGGVTHTVELGPALQVVSSEGGDGRRSCAAARSSRRVDALLRSSCAVVGQRRWRCWLGGGPASWPTTG